MLLATAINNLVSQEFLRLALCDIFLNTASKDNLHPHCGQLIARKYQTLARMMQQPFIVMTKMLNSLKKSLENDQ